MDEMLPHVGHLPGAVCKNLFMYDKKRKGLWLLAAHHERDVKLTDLAKKVSAPGGLRFAEESLLIEKLGVRQGCVTPFALINDRKSQVKFIVDEDLINGKHEMIYFHPLDNSATTGISPNDFLKFIKATGHQPIKVKFDDKQPAQKPTQNTTGAAKVVKSDSSRSAAQQGERGGPRPVCKYINVELCGYHGDRDTKSTEGTILLENPTGRFYSFVQELQQQVQIVFGLGGRQVALYKCRDMKNQLTHLNVEECLALHGTTLYAHVD